MGEGEVGQCSCGYETETKGKHSKCSGSSLLNKVIHCVSALLLSNGTNQMLHVSFDSSGHQWCKKKKK